MAKQVRLIEATRKELDRYLDDVEIDPAFPAFVDECDRRGDVTIEINSDGIDYAVRRILGNNGLSKLRVRANTLSAVSGTRYRLDFPNAGIGCAARAGNCKCTAARRLSGTVRSSSTTILIGDGASDFCVASRVNFVFAKARLLGYCRAAGIRHMSFDTFVDISRDLTHVADDLVLEAEFGRMCAEASLEL